MSNASFPHASLILSQTLNKNSGSYIPLVTDEYLQSGLSDGKRTYSMTTSIRSKNAF